MSGAAAPGAIPPEFTIEVEGIGAFTFRKRTMRLEVQIGVEYSRLAGGAETPTDFLVSLAGAISVLKVLTVQAPPKWDLDAMDPLDDSAFGKLFQVFGALRAREDAFRGKPSAGGNGAGAGGSAVDGVLVPPDVPPAAD